MFYLNLRFLGNILHLAGGLAPNLTKISIIPWTSASGGALNQ